jgi:hypothetical protein
MLVIWCLGFLGEKQYKIGAFVESGSSHAAS